MNLLNYFQDHHSEILSDIESVVKHESPSHRKDLTDRCADYIYELFYDRLGVRGETYSNEKTGKHLKFEIGEGETTVAILAHYDTVWDEGTLSYYIDGDKAYGPGTVDMKAGLIQGMWALKALQEEGRSLNKKVRFLITSDEEIQSPTGKYFIKNQVTDCDAVLVVEPPTGYSGLLKTARKGDAVYQVSTSGVASHAGNDPRPNANAINEIAHQIIKLESLSDLANGTSVNVGVINGGTLSNVTAEHAEIEVDVRFTKKEEAYRVDQAIQNLVPKLQETSLQVKGGVKRFPMERTEGTLQLYDHAEKVAFDLGIELGESLSGGVSDGNFTSAMGIPTLDGLGAIGDGLHATHEHIVISEIPRRSALLAGLLHRICK
ncbi:M20 family metallopeptidase [Alkalibacillus aidingensis]|uniref:M20 family metallopeptidase n=1 Tax=Alkalibacillus aidingensis TaxID=2747607 RepID=UPI001660952D|nr:M20 family metallopeptidase [Alkalibacillus aidingensis]